MLELWKKPIFVITDSLCNSSTSNGAEELQDKTSNSFKTEEKTMAKGRDTQKTEKKKSEKTLKEKRKEKKEKKSKKDIM